MAVIIADNIISPLGFTTASNLEAVTNGSSALCNYDGATGIPFPFTASLFSVHQRESLSIKGYTLFESLAIHSIRRALGNCAIAPGSRVALVLSSTKSNAGHLSLDDNEDNIGSPGAAAKKIAEAVGIQTTPVVVCNACISGVSALILGERLLNINLYDNVIVCGADVQCPFVMAGFQSFKAMSQDECHPFDMERNGLNLGEAAATVILGIEDGEDKNMWHIVKGATRNDAYHITTPSPKGEGCYRALKSVIAGVDTESLALVNAHGTATMYNDQMESKAIERATLTEIPVNALKGYYGHTMGAAGILETILTMHSLDKGFILGTRGFEEIGVSGKINIIARNTETQKRDFIKLISGFGGSNASVRLCKQKYCLPKAEVKRLQTSHRIHLSPDLLEIDGVRQEVEPTGNGMLASLYKNKVADYPKYHKMDGLAKLGFIASELLLEQEEQVRFVGNETRAIILFNRNATINADKKFLKSICDEENFYPSPSDFAYTLSNIVNGEIAIRNKYYGETCFYILPEKDKNVMMEILQTSFLDNTTDSILAGWLEYGSDTEFEADLCIIKRR